MCAAPVTSENATPTAGIDECDVLVLGGGGAGLAAAVAASSRGVRTVLLEKREALGGTTAMSIGSFSAACTRLQRRRGIVDSADAFFEDIAAFNPTLATRGSPIFRALLAAESGCTLTWLEDLGVPFAGPFPEPPHRVARMHNAVPGPRMYITCLEKAARERGVTFVLGAKAERAIVDDQGEVLGIEYRQEGVLKQVRARRGVIIASGDFSGDVEMRRRFIGEAAAAAHPVYPENSGDGHRLAEAIGADFANMDYAPELPSLRFPPPTKPSILERIPSWRWLARMAAWVSSKGPTAMLRPLVKPLIIVHMSPSIKLFEQGAILLNLDGDRFCDELKQREMLALQRGSAGYVVLDQKIADSFTRWPNYISTAPGVAYAYFQDYASARPDLVHSARSVGDLAAVLGMEPARLERALKAAQHPFEGKLYALGPVESVMLPTKGGIVVDERCRVLRRDGQAIPGLFGAGNVALGRAAFLGHGTHIAWAFTSGRLAGAGAADRPPRRDQ